MPDQAPSPLGAGPFSNILSEPAYQASQQPASGFQGPGGSVAMFADKFLAGLSQGRAQAYQRSELQNARTQEAIQRAIGDVSNSNLPEQAKQQQMSKLQGILGNLVFHGIPDEKGKKKSGGGDKGGSSSGGGDQQQGLDPEHPGHQILGVMKKIVGGLIGPGGQKQPYSKEEIHGTLGEVYNFIGDPKNSLQSQVATADQSLMKTYDTVRKANGGKDPTVSQLMQNPDFLKQYTAAMSVTGKATPGISLILDAAQEQSRQQDPAYVAGVNEKKAMTDYYGTRSAAQEQYRTKDGAMVTRGQDGAWHDQSGNPIDPNSTQLQGLTPFNQKQTAPASAKVSVFADKNGNMFKRDAAGNVLGPLTYNGKQMNQGSPMGRMMMQEGFVNERDFENRNVQINENYDAKKDAILKDTKLPEKDKAKRLQENEEDREKTLGLKHKAGTKQTAATGKPPVSKAAASKQKEEEVWNKFSSWLTGAKPATAGAAPTGPPTTAAAPKPASAGVDWANQ